MNFNLSTFTKDNRWFYIISFIFCMRFFQYAGISNTMSKLPSFVVITGLLIFTFNLFCKNVKNNIFRYVRLVIISYFISFIPALLFHDQSILLSYQSTMPYLGFLFFFFFIKKRPSIETMEFLILFFAFLFTILWLYAFSQTPRLVFGYNNNEGLVDDSEARGMLRINFWGMTFMYLAYFLSLNKFIYERKIKYLVYLSYFAVFIVLQLTRQCIIFTVLVSLIYLWNKVSKVKLFIIFSIISLLFIVSSVRISDDGILGSMLDLTQRQIERQNSGETNERLLEYQYFFTEFHPNFITRIIGNGYPHMESGYGRYCFLVMSDQHGIFFSDVGYGMMFAVLGLLGLFSFILLFIKSYRTKMPDSFQYVRLFMLFIIFGNITSAWIMFPCCQICMSICFYIMFYYSPSSKYCLLRKKV